MASNPAKPRVLREFFTGVSLVFRGFGVWRTAPGLMLLGLIPALIVAIAFLAGIIALGLNLETITAATTPFAETWDEPFRTGIRLVAGLAFLIVAVLFVINTFTTITLIVGQPFYERIWQHSEARFGVIPQHQDGFWKAAGRGIGDGLRMLVPTILIGIAIFALGLIPLVGTVLSAILGALVGSWFLSVELAGMAFDSRGMTLRERRAALKSRRPLAVGYGLAAYLLFLVPLGAIVVMPAAVAGSALLARRILDEPQLSEPARTT
jgi:CysZ protein